MRFKKDSSTAYHQYAKGLRRAKTFEKITDLLPFILRGMQDEFGPTTFPLVLKLVCLNSVRSFYLRIPSSTGILESELAYLEVVNKLFVESLEVIRDCFPKKLNTQKVHRASAHLIDGMILLYFQ